MTIGQKLCAWREARKLKQREAAKAAGISQSVWAAIEVDQFKRIGLDVAQRIVEVTGGEVTLSDFSRRRKKVKPIPLESSTDLSKPVVHARAAS